MSSTSLELQDVNEETDSGVAGPNHLRDEFKMLQRVRLLPSSRGAASDPASWGRIATTALLRT
jgi:hypothetical protein